jgi:hypothetical protein
MSADAPLRRVEVMMAPLGYAAVVICLVVVLRQYLVWVFTK